MQIRDAMHTSILSVSPQAPISEATKLRKSHGHPHTDRPGGSVAMRISSVARGTSTCMTLRGIQAEGRKMEG
jgi:hypothetical protein